MKTARFIHCTRWFHTTEALNDHYSTLGVSRNASVSEIKSAFYGLSKQYHPDRTRNLESESEREQAEVKYRGITQAYETLCDQSKKSAYDASLDSSASRGGASSNPYGATRSARNARSSSGLNHMRSRVYNYDRSYKPTNSHDSLNQKYTSGSNHDVPHFDFDKHRKQQSGYEDHRRRMDQQKFELRQSPHKPYQNPYDAEPHKFSITSAGAASLVAATLMLSYLVIK